MCRIFCPSGDDRIRVVIAMRYRSGSGFDRGNEERGGRTERVGASGEDVRRVLCMMHLADVGVGDGVGREGCRFTVIWSLYEREMLLRRSFVGRDGRVYSDRSLM